VDSCGSGTGPVTDVKNLNRFQMCIRRGDFCEQMGNYQIFKNDCAVWGCKTNSLLCRKSELPGRRTVSSTCSQQVQSACHSNLTGPLTAAAVTGAQVMGWALEFARWDENCQRKPRLKQPTKNFLI
jgi:hypothetical protein